VNLNVRYLSLFALACRKQPRNRGLQTVVEGRTERPRLLCTGQFFWRALLWTDPKDHTGPWNLNQRSVGGGDEFRGGIGLTEVAHSPVVGNPGAAVGTESEARRPIEAVLAN